MSRWKRIILGRWLISILLIILVGCMQHNKTSLEASQSPGAYQTMDYGSVISATIQIDWPEGSLVRKGLAIRLSPNAAVIFDTDLLAYAAGVKNGWLDISQTLYTNIKGTSVATIEGRQVFATSDELAGWAKDGQFTAQRLYDGLGNLPKEWAHYKGYYRYEDKVLLSYSVGGTDILDLPAALKYKGVLIFARTMKISPSDDSLEALILKEHDSWSIVKTMKHGIILNTGKSYLGVSLGSAAENVRLEEAKNGLITLQIPPSGRSQIIRIGIFKLDSLDEPLFSKVQTYINSIRLPDFNKMIQGGPAQWNKEIATKGILSDKNSGYVLDKIKIPFQNPWGSWMRLSDIDFFDGGSRAAVTTLNGDVWIVSGLNSKLKNIEWNRYASGLFLPIGVAVVEGDIYVTERSQLTRLVDLNGDGEADYYQNFNNEGVVYPRGLTEGLVVDSAGYFYFFKNGNRVPSDIPTFGALIRVSPDGTKRVVYARGYRSANTLGLGPRGNIFTVDQQGDWVPADRLDVVKEKGNFYGYRPHGGKDLPVGKFETPVAWLPHTVENSAGFIQYAGDQRWGPLAGHMILSSYGQRTLFVVLLERLGGKLQGGIVQIPGIKTQSGVMRASVNPADGQLYVVGLLGWGTTAKAAGGFARIRYAGGDVNMPKKLNITPEGVKITFTNPVNPAIATNIRSYDVEWWEYIYSEHYGSPAMSLKHPLQRGHDTVRVGGVRISKDKRTIFLKIPNMQSVMQMKITYNLRFKNGQEAQNTIYFTVNWLFPDSTDQLPTWQQRITAGVRKPFLKKGEFSIGKRLINKRECKSCHHMQTKSYGPSFMKIARRYSKNKQTINRLAKTIINGGSGNWGERVMPPHLKILKSEAERIVRYILSLSKNKDH